MLGIKRALRSNRHVILQYHNSTTMHTPIRGTIKPIDYYTYPIKQASTVDLSREIDSAPVVPQIIQVVCSSGHSRQPNAALKMQDRSNESITQLTQLENQDQKRPVSIKAACHISLCN